MNIAALEYSLSTKSIDIYISGCKGYCRECCNKEIWDPNYGDELNEDFYNKVLRKFAEFPSLIRNIMVYGGEPLDQDVGKLSEFLYRLSEFERPLWLFTHFPLESVPEEIKSRCSYIKTGKYIPELKCEDNIQFGVKLATSNQSIHKI